MSESEIKEISFHFLDTWQLLCICQYWLNIKLRGAFVGLTEFKLWQACLVKGFGDVVFLFFCTTGNPMVSAPPSATTNPVGADIAEIPVLH